MWLKKVGSTFIGFLQQFPNSCSKKIQDNFASEFLDYFSNHPDQLYTFFLSYTFALGTCLLILPHVLPPSDWPFDTRAHIAARLDQKITSSDKEVLESSFFQSC